MKTTSEIRQVFLDYFAGKDHRCVASSPLVPANDPTLLFTNAGMVQFKDVFLGAEKRSYNRAVTSQRCVRAGGKHNDLDEVGYTARHHTFFEMLGNFSFGDYFKKDAIRYAWDLLTRVYGLSADRLWVTVYKTDDEAYEIWRDQIGVPEERLIRIGDKPGGKAYESDNFWAMGDTGPCGPCTEIFYDHGEGISGDPPGSGDGEGDRYVEIWNLVFMQFDRDADGNMNPLPQPCVDTGMGLERITAVLQGVHNNYQIDLFKTLVEAAADATGCADKGSPSLNVIADHIRACSFLVVDGVLPSNEGRGYVLRRIIRRAIRHGYKLGQTGLFFSTLVDPLVAEMGEAYPELKKKADLVRQVLLKEEQRFAETLEQGMSLLESVIDDLSGSEIPGEAIFKLYDTYGFPVDLVADIARERDLTMDEAGFEQAMEQQRERGRAAGKFVETIKLSSELIQKLSKTKFMGYEKKELQNTEIISIINNNNEEKELLNEAEQGVLILQATPFYAESGGQIGDTGIIENANGCFEVQDTRKIAGEYFGHFGKVIRGVIKSGEVADAKIDANRRAAIVLHHSATHLMHAALKAVLGSHVEQKGSLVAEDRLRFDFSHSQPVTAEQLDAIETMVNDRIRGNTPAKINLMPYDQALDTGAVALFGEKYGDVVRVLQYGDFSIELCGGTHVASLGEIGLFKILSEGGIAAGVRRIEAVAGPVAIHWVQKMDAMQQRMAGLLRASPDTLEQNLQQLLDKNRKLEKENQRLQSRLTSSSGKDLAALAKDVGGISVLVADMKDADARTLRETVDDLKSRMGKAIIVLGAIDGEKVRLIAGVTPDLTDQFSAGDVVNFVAAQVGGKGGGRRDLAQAGGTRPEALSGALDSVLKWVESEI